MKSNTKYAIFLGGFALLPVASIVACGTSSSASKVDTGDGGISLGDSSVVPFVDAGDQDVQKIEVDGGFPAGDAGIIPADRFITTVVSTALGGCGGFGASFMPTVVEGPPIGGGATTGSLDVLSLGVGGTIVVSFAPNAIVDGPGPDFIVFENAFYVGGNTSDIFAEPGEVSVSDDGTTWTTFPCTATATTPPYGQCAGWHPVYSAPNNGISPIDPNVAGGDAFDLATIGVTHAKFVRIVDHSGESCTPGPSAPNQAGFDLDAISIVNAETP